MWVSRSFRQALVVDRGAEWSGHAPTPAVRPPLRRLRGLLACLAPGGIAVQSRPEKLGNSNALTLPGQPLLPLALVLPRLLERIEEGIRLGSRGTARTPATEAIWTTAGDSQAETTRRA
jgi:hypothetical protein